MEGSVFIYGDVGTCRSIKGCSGECIAVAMRVREWLFIVFVADISWPDIVDSRRSRFKVGAGRKVRIGGG